MCCNGALRMVAGTADNWTPAERYGYNETGNITGRSLVSDTQWVTRTYSYSGTVHAVTQISNGWEFEYDGTGNMTGRDDSGSYVEAFDVENPASLRSRDYSRLVAVTDTQTLSVTRFIYDGDGNRVMTTYPDGSQTAFVGDHYEVEGNTTRSYYFFGSQRVAMRVDDGASEEVFWFHTDHPGSTSLLSTISGTLAADSETRFLPYGEYRVEPTADLTDHGFTGHKQQDPVGLINMRARYYVPGVGRFASPGAYFPDPTNPQGLDRYSYARGNPVYLWDPTGHAVRPSCWWCDLSVDVSGWPALGTGMAKVACFFLGCHVDTGRGLITGPSLRDAATDAALGLVNPMTMVPIPGVDEAEKAASNAIRRGLQRLDDVANNSRVYRQFRLGAQAQLQRARYWLASGELTGIEVITESGGRIDMTLLGDNAAVEVK